MAKIKSTALSNLFGMKPHTLRFLTSHKMYVGNETIKSHCTY